MLQAKGRDGNLYISKNGLCFYFAKYFALFSCKGKVTNNSCRRVEVDLVGRRQHEAMLAVILSSSRIDWTKVLPSVPAVDRLPDMMILHHVVGAHRTDDLVVVD